MFSLLRLTYSLGLSLPSLPDPSPRVSRSTGYVQHTLRLDTVPPTLSLGVADILRPYPVLSAWVGESPLGASLGESETQQIACCVTISDFEMSHVRNPADVESYVRDSLSTELGRIAVTTLLGTLGRLSTRSQSSPGSNSVLALVHPESHPALSNVPVPYYQTLCVHPEIPQGVMWYIPQPPSIHIGTPIIEARRSVSNRLTHFTARSVLSVDMRYTHVISWGMEVGT